MDGPDGGGVISVERQGRLTVLRLSGEVGADVVDDFWLRHDGVVPAVDLIDGADVTFIGAGGLSLLVAVQGRSRDLGYASSLTRPAACVRLLLDVLGLHLQNGLIAGL